MVEQYYTTYINIKQLGVLLKRQPGDPLYSVNFK